MATYIITGAGRGIGLELVAQLLALPANQVTRVYAITRNEHSKQLHDLVKHADGRLVNTIVTDFSNEDEVRRAASAVEATLDGRGIDVLINNAGIVSGNGLLNVARKLY